MNKTKSEELIRQLKESENVHIGSELYFHDGKHLRTVRVNCNILNLYRKRRFCKRRRLFCAT